LKLEAYARLTIYHAKTNELLCDAIVLRESELVPALVVKAAPQTKCFAMVLLLFVHNGILILSSILYPLSMLKKHQCHHSQDLEVARACAALSYAHPGVLRLEP